MDKDIFQGYKGASLTILKKYKVRVWGQATVNTSRGTFIVQFYHALKMMMISIS